MNQRASLTSIVLAMACLAWASPNVVVGADATGTIKGEITANGVRSPEDVVVYIENAPGEQKPPAKPAVMDQKKLVFVPHVLVVVKGTVVEFKNGDPLLHNVFWQASDDGAIPANNLGTWGQGTTEKYTFNKEGHVVLLCNIHAEMEGHILVVQNPFFSVVGKDGKYEIKDVPAGSYTLKTFYPQPRKLRSKSIPVTVAAGQTATQDITLGRR